MTERQGRAGVMGSGDGWTICTGGHRHWGLFGAAGLLITDGERVILQHRAPWTHEGGRWGIPGGARDAHESAVDAALREAGEEAGLRAEDIEPIGVYEADHGGWSYSTVIARPRRTLTPTAYNAESVSVEWVDISMVDDLPLHDGFALAWPHLQDHGAPVHLLAGPAVADDPLLRSVALHGLSVAELPSGMWTGTLHRIFPVVEFVSDAGHAARRAGALPAGTQTMVLLDPADLALLATSGVG
jgi:8-oxo-dGTP pyrophosphatase MutT (NUDIX family)